MEFLSPGSRNAPPNYPAELSTVHPSSWTFRQVHPFSSLRYPDILIPSRRSHSQWTFSSLRLPASAQSFDSLPLLSPSTPASALDSPFILARQPLTLPTFSFLSAVLIPSGHSHPLPTFSFQPPFSLHRHMIAMNGFNLSKLENEKNHVAEMASPDMRTTT